MHKERPDPDFQVINDLEAFKAMSDVIIANRKEPELDDVEGRFIHVIYLG